MEDIILNDPDCSVYTDISRRWINEAFLDGAEYGERITLNRVLEWMDAHIEKEKALIFRLQWINGKINVK